MTVQNRAGQSERAYNVLRMPEPTDRRGRLRIRLWQCLCMRLNPKPAERCVACARPRPEEPTE